MNVTPFLPSQFMYEEYTRQSLPQRQYRELLGSAIYVFNSNNSFIIENILKNDTGKCYSWYDLIDEPSGKLSQPIKETITRHSNTQIAQLFDKIVGTRNRIIHSFPVTLDDEQVLHTKDKQHNQYTITEEFLMSFIKENEQLSLMLHDFRGY